MAVSHQQPALPEKSSRLRRLAVPEMWASIAISVVWLVVAVDALWGPDFIASSNAGNFTKIPSAVITVVFAYLATRVIAKHGFDRDRDA